MINIIIAYFYVPVKNQKKNPCRESGFRILHRFNMIILVHFIFLCYDENGMKNM